MTLPKQGSPRPTKRGRTLNYRIYLLACLIGLAGSSVAQSSVIGWKFEQGCDGVKVYFTDLSNGEMHHWDLGDGTYSTDARPVHQYPYGSILDVTLIVTDQDGNITIHSLDVATPPTTDLSNLAFPNIFTPNGDGINDVFGPITDLILGPCTQISIFNRFGQRLHFGDGYDLTWDGRSFAGEKAVAGTYFYVLKVNGVEFTGTFSLHL